MSISEQGGVTLRLGELGVDIVTGFKGVIVARTEYLSGGVSIGLQCRELKDARPVDVQWFDATRVRLHQPEEPGQYV